MHLEVGKLVQWHKTVSNYGHVHIINAVVRKIGKRVTIEAPLKGGGTKLVRVQPENLHEPR